MSSAFIPHRATTDPRYDDNLQTDDYYPAIRVSVWRERMRVDDTVSDARSHEILSTAVLLVNDELAVWREAQQTPLPTANSTTTGKPSINAPRHLNLSSIAMWTLPQKAASVPMDWSAASAKHYNAHVRRCASSSVNPAPPSP